MGLINNNRTCRLKLRRGDVVDILIAIANCYDAGEKWQRLHDEIRRQFDEQEAASALPEGGGIYE